MDLLLMKRGDLRDVAHGALDDLAESFSRPSFRAGLAVSMLSTAMLARAGARASVAIPVSLMIGWSVERLYEMLEDIHGKLTGDAVPQAPQARFRFHPGFPPRGPCPGHPVDDFPEDCGDAAGQV